VSALFPVTGAFVRHAELLIDPAMGFAIGWNVVYGNMLSIPGEIAAILVLIQYWTDKYPFEIITALIILTFIIGLIGVGVYGDVEYLMAIIKIALVIGIIIMGLVIDLGGIPGQDATGFQSWKDPGPFVEFLVSGTWGKFLGFWAVLNNAVYSFAGVESISIAAAETKSPRQNIPKACRRVFVRVAFFYMTTVFVIGLLVPSNDPDLGGYSGTSTQSPFVIVASRAGIKFVPAVINAVVLASAWSSSNQSILSGTRVISGLAREGRAPIVFSWTTPWGSPFVGVLLQTAVATLSYLCLSDGALKVFYYFLDLTAAATLVNWIMILICHIRMRQALVRQGISRNELPWHHMWTREC
jgi:amino acid transporter